MNIVIFIILSIIYIYLFFKIYNENKNFDGLKASIVLFILQILSYFGNHNTNPTGKNFIQISGNLVSDICQNVFIIIALIIVIIKYKKQP